MKGLIMSENLNCNTIPFKEKQLRITSRILSKKNEFKERGKQIVRKEDFSFWESLVDKLYEDVDYLWNTGVCLEGALFCMECLSNGDSVDEIVSTLYESNINQSRQGNIPITRTQGQLITHIVSVYHNRGEEFSNYHQLFFDNCTNNKKREGDYFGK